MCLPTSALVNHSESKASAYDLHEAAPCDRSVASAQVLQITPVRSQSERVEECLRLRQVEMAQVDHKIVAFTGQGNKTQAQNALGRGDGDAVIGIASLPPARGCHAACGHAFISPQVCVRDDRAVQPRIQHQPGAGSPLAIALDSSVRSSRR